MIGAGIITEFYAVIWAPIGYQDERGFHVGAKQADDDESGRWMNPS